MKIQLTDICKRFGPVVANDGISLTVAPGTLHGILGENGAGKSTLMKILAGYQSMTRGTIRLDGRLAAYQSPAQAAALGIGMLYQDPLDFPALTVLDNFIIGQGSRLGWHRRRARAEFETLCRSVCFDLSPDHPVSRLTVGERQQLEILRLLSLGVRALILDEPTTGISTVQKETLFQALKMMAAQGKSVILVSHKIEDVETWCDQVTVLRSGRVTGDQMRPFDTGRILEMMFGEPPPAPETRPRAPGANAITLEAVSARGGRSGLNRCTATIAQGEIVGLAGLEGSGQSVFLRAATGLARPTRGQIRMDGEDMAGKDVHAFMDRGTVFLPADRLEEGLIPGLTVADHWALKTSEGRFLVDRRRAEAAAGKGIETFRVKGEPQTCVEALSGGNQQRLLLSFLPHAPKLLLLENPTRGLDLESAAWIWNRLGSFRDKGTAIAFSSSELDEILAVADRILVFFNGDVIKDVPANEIDAAELGRAIAGKTKNDRAACGAGV